VGGHLGCFTAAALVHAYRFGRIYGQFFPRVDGKENVATQCVDNVQRVTHLMSVTHHTQHITRHTQHVTRHTSHTTRHTSHVTRQRINIAARVAHAHGLQDIRLIYVHAKLQRPLESKRVWGLVFRGNHLQVIRTSNVVSGQQLLRMALEQIFPFEIRALTRPAVADVAVTI
jgi:hypothetical protein